MTKISDIINSLPQQDKELLDRHISVINLKKREFAFDQFTHDNSVYYVANGILRKYLLKDGLEKTIDFYFSDEIYFPSTQYNDSLTNCFLQAIDSTTIFKINKFKYEDLSTKNLKLLELESKVIHLAFAQVSERLQNFQTMSATERYINLLKRNHNIIQNVPLIYVASYLGINNASLSKIRAKLK